MAARQDQGVLRHLHTLLNLGAIGELTDGQLLERFATAPGEVSELAFAALVERHGPMVLRVCRGVLAEPHDRQDAFQATFLVLVRQAGVLWVRDSLGPWLHQVAYRTACHARATAARRRWHERRAAELANEAVAEVDNEAERLLHEEINRLPERYRVPIVLCDLGGRTHEQAARHLGWPVGTVKSRLARGRDALRDRLRRRGLGPEPGLLAAPLRPRGADTAVPPALAEATTRTAIQTLTARTLLLGSAATLARGVLRTMSLIHALKVAVLVLVVAGATTSTPLLAQRKRERGRPAPPPAAPAVGQDARGQQTLIAKPARSQGTFVTAGRLVSAGFVDVASSVEGQATILFAVPNRTVVKKGDLVCELDASALEHLLLDQEIATQGAEDAYQNARLARELAETALNEYVEGTFRENQTAAQDEVDTSRDELRQAENRLERTKHAKKRMKELLEPKAGPQNPADIVAELEVDDRLEAAEAAVRRRKLAVERAENRRKLLARYTREKMLKERQVEIEKARSNESARKRILELEQRKEQKLRTQISNCKLLAPRDGRVIYAMERGRGLGAGEGGVGGPGGLAPQGTRARSIEVGESVHQRQHIFSIPTGPFTVTLLVSRAVAERLAVGNPANIKYGTFPNEPLHGVIEKISAIGQTPGHFGMMRGVQPTVFDGRGGGVNRMPAESVITIKIDKAPTGLAPDMFAQAEIFASERDDILSVPAAAILKTARDGWNRVVVKKPDGTLELRKVIPGAATDTTTEILEGLERGESIVLDPGNVSDEELRQEIRQLQQGGFQ